MGSTNPSRKTTSCWWALGSVLYHLISLPLCQNYSWCNSDNNIRLSLRKDLSHCVCGFCINQSPALRKETKGSGGCRENKPKLRNKLIKRHVQVLIKSIITSASPPAEKICLVYRGSKDASTMLKISIINRLEIGHQKAHYLCLLLKQQEGKSWNP